MCFSAICLCRLSVFPLPLPLPVEGLLTSSTSAGRLWVNYLVDRSAVSDKLTTSNSSLGTWPTERRTTPDRAERTKTSKRNQESTTGAHWLTGFILRQSSDVASPRKRRHGGTSTLSRLRSLHSDRWAYLCMPSWSTGSIRGDRHQRRTAWVNNTYHSSQLELRRSASRKSTTNLMINFII
jgi:hypothetical protein